MTPLESYHQLITLFAQDARANQEIEVADAFTTVLDVLDMGSIDATTVFALVTGTVSLPALLREIAGHHLDRLDVVDYPGAEALAEAQEAEGHPDAETTRDICCLVEALLDASFTLESETLVYG